uniref:dTDP-glucose 4,6-dehydratase n=1 Tax=Magnetococcus massalia (strain MO-1) TaxID=451514 RepID=A0A1S7LCZ9_MAGMO|nr:Conserved protein of unknown function. putative phosphatase [Candidatus Magnetococcus massalia]
MQADCDESPVVDPKRDPSSLTFKRLDDAIHNSHRVAQGHAVQVVMRWGDPVTSDAAPFDPQNPTPEGQKKQFGYNNDFVTFMPLPAGSRNSNHGLLCVNHEYTKSSLMFPEALRESDDKADIKRVIEVEQAAHGHSILEVSRDARGHWIPMRGSTLSRRITALDTELEIQGPAAGHARLQTAQDPTGRLCIGTLNNCAGGVTPWGTLLLGEENFDGYFGGEPEMSDEGESYKRYGIKGNPSYHWHEVDGRFNVEQTPHEPNRFGWVVEVDPYDPQARPVKRTALGRFKHEGATCAVLPDKRVAVYSGDDGKNEYLYRFVTRDAYNPHHRAANRTLLDHGTLSVAKFQEDGFLVWIPLVHGEGGLTAENGFHSQADLLIETRRAADLVGATPMDRPEDVQPHPQSGRIYVALTNNSRRSAEGVDAANPRGPNPYGHILELTPPGAEVPDHGAEKYFWNILLVGGPFDKGVGSHYHHLTPKYGNWLAAPDNFAFDNRGRIWIASDQGKAQAHRGHADGLFGCDLEGPGRALPKRFFSVPSGAEMCGPAFTPDNRTLFLAVQHPGDDRGSDFENPSTRWPDFKKGLPPRPSVVAISRFDGKPIG